MERVLLASPRGFCAGVAYAIEVVELALKIHGAPLYVRHAIVHNESVVRSFSERGVRFVEDVGDVPPGQAVVFSAHGVSPAVRAQAAERGLVVVDATCPLVTKVHNEVRRFAAKGYHMLYIGHRGHVEAVGTMGVAPGRMTLVEGPEDAGAVEPPDGPLAVVTQTTLSVDEVAETVAVLRERFPNIVAPAKEDICYATTNRQGAVKALAKECSLVVVVGSDTSSNSNRLREVAERSGSQAVLLNDASLVEPAWALEHRTIGVTSGASTPERLVEDVVGRLLEIAPGAVVETLATVEESIEFRPPRDLIQLAMAKG